jgi:hypothetical protein
MPVDVEVIAGMVAACPSVARLYPGRASEVATYLPGRRVEGVRVADDELEVHVVAAWDVPLPQVADEVRGAATPLSEGLPVAVFIDDVDVPATLFGIEEPPEEASEAALTAAGAPLPAETPVTEPGAAGLGATAPPGVPVSAPLDPVPGIPVPSPPMDPVLDPIATESGGPAADVLPGEVLPDDVVLEDEVPGDVIPGEPVTPPPPPATKKKRSPKRSGGSA